MTTLSPLLEFDGVISRISWSSSVPYRAIWVLGWTNKEMNSGFIWTGTITRHLLLRDIKQRGRMFRIWSAAQQQILHFVSWCHDNPVTEPVTSPSIFRLISRDYQRFFTQNPGTVLSIQLPCYRITIDKLNLLLSPSIILYPTFGSIENHILRLWHAILWPLWHLFFAWSLWIRIEAVDKSHIRLSNIVGELGMTIILRAWAKEAWDVLEAESDIVEMFHALPFRPLVPSLIKTVAVYSLAWLCE